MRQQMDLGTRLWCYWSSSFYWAGRHLLDLQWCLRTNVPLALTINHGGRPEMKVRKRTKAHSHGTAKFPLQLSQSLESSPHQPHSRSCSTGSMLAANRSSQGMDSRSDQWSRKGKTWGKTHEDVVMIDCPKLPVFCTATGSNQETQRRSDLSLEV